MARQKKQPDTNATKGRPVEPTDVKTTVTRSRRAGILPPGTAPLYVDYVGAQMLFGLTRGLLEKQKEIPRYPVSGKKTVFRVHDLVAFVESRRSA